MKINNFNSVLKKTMLISMLFFSVTTLKAQLTGVKTIPTDYASIAAFVTDLNTQGVGAGGVMLDIPSGYTETAPAGGFLITATGTTANNIVFTSTGGAPFPIITASSSLTVGLLNDAIFKIVGGDYITISNLDLRENAANTVTTAGSNTMTEWGIALLYATTTNGCQNVSILNNTIALGATYQNAMGIYANSTHAAGTPTTAATATSLTGGNHNLAIKGNTISNVNLGIVVVGPTAAADMNNTVSIGGTTPAEGNTITYGLNGTFSSYANVSGTVNGILIRNSINATVSNNSLTSNGTVTAGTLNGIQFAGFSNAPTGTFTQNINNNTLAIRSNAVAGNVVGITQPSGSATVTSICNINNNNFTNFGHTIAAASGTLTFISLASTHFTTNINANTFTNISVNTTGSVTFISHSYTMPANGTKSVSNNAIVTGFTKTGAGGTVTFMTTGTSSPNSASGVYSNNTISNITLTGATTFTAINDTDGSSSGANKIFNGNTISNINGGTSTITGINCTYWGGTSSSISNNTLSNINGQGTITGINLGSSFSGATNSVINGNTITGLTSSGAGGTVIGISCSNTSTGILISNSSINGLSSTAASTISGISISGSTSTSLVANKIHSLSSSNAGGSVNGLLVSSGTLSTLTNNIIGNLTAPVANAANPINGINITGGTAVNAYYNSVYLNATSSGALFGTSAISASTTPNITLNNNIFVNNSTSNGAGLSVAYRRSTTTLTSYQATSDRNDFFAPVIHFDGTASYTTLAAYQTAMATRDANSISENPNFASTTGSDANFLHINTALPTLLDNGASNIAGITTDFDANIRQGNPGYPGTGTAPDMGADEFELAIINCSTANGGTISPSTNTVCEGSTKTISSTGYSNEFGNTFQWKVSTTAGGPYVNVTGGTGATTASYTTGTLTPGTYYYIMETTCSFGSLTGVSNEYTLVVNPTPVVAVSPSSATYCSPGTAVSLTASGATTYAWSPSTGLSAVLGATVNASPATTTTYTVIGSALGCPSLPTTVPVTVNISPVISSVSATPSSLCAIGNSQLNAVASVNDVYTVNSIPYSLVPTPGTGVTTLANTGVATTALTSGTLDDGGWNSQTLPFTFNFFGTNYTSFAVSTNGFITLGATASTFAGYNNVFPSTFSANPSIGATYSDLDFRTIGSINYFVTGTAPNRQLVINWSGGNFYNAVGAITTQLIIYETTNIIEVHTTNSTGTNNAVLGIQNSGATKFNTAPGRNNTLWTVSTPDAYQFTPPAITYSWSPATFLSSTAIANPAITGINATTTYTLSATANGCTTTATTTVTVNPLPTAPTATNSSQCGSQIPTASVASTSGLPTPTFVWYDAAVAGTALQTGTSTTFTSVVGTTTTFYVAEKNTTTGCESTLTPVTVTVSSADLIEASINFPTICIGETVNLSVANLNPTPLQSYTYTWSSTAGNGLSSTTGSAVTATPTTAGSYVYTVNGVDGGCNAVSTVNLTVNPFVATLSAVNVTCNGAANGTFTLSTSSCGTAPFTYSVDGGAFGSIPTNLTPGTYSVITKDANGFTVAPQSITITEPSAITVPGGIPNVSVCQDATTAQLNVSATTNLTATINFSLSAQPVEVNSAPGSVISTAVLPVLPAGAIVNSITLSSNGLIPNGGDYQSDVRLGLSGAFTNTAAQGTGTLGSGTVAGTPYNYTRSIPVAGFPTTGGTINVVYWNSFNDVNPGDDATFPVGPNAVTLTINYSVPNPTVNWYNASTGGTLLGSGTPFETVGTTVLPTTATPGTYNFYAEGTNGTCVSPSRTLVTVTVKPKSTSTTTITACGSYTWTNGTNYTTSGTYTQTLTNAVGCDSIATLALTIKPTSASSTPVTACSSYTWTNGTTYNTSGTYTQTLTNAVGCDSIATLVLTINQPTSSSTPVTACSSYTWTNGTTYVASGTYTQTLTNALGCDSIATLVLTINQPTSSSTPVTACDSYTWTNGTTYVASGTYTQTLVNSVGCDSIATLVLTINNSTTGTDVITACDSYTWIDGVNYTTSNSTATFTLTNAAGCDSIVTLNLTINNSTTGTDVIAACDSYTWIDGVTYTTNNSTATFTLTNAAGCDSIVTLNLTITATPVAVATDNGNATISSATAASYQWIDCATGNPIAGATSQVYTVTANGTYAVIASNGSCSDTSACVTIDYMSVKEMSVDAISIYPNPTRDNVTVTMSSASASIEIIDAQGKLLSVTQVVNGDKIDLSTYETGMYIFRVKTENGTSIFRVSKN